MIIFFFFYYFKRTGNGAEKSSSKRKPRSYRRVGQDSEINNRGNWYAVKGKYLWGGSHDTPKNLRICGRLKRLLNQKLNKKRKKLKNKNCTYIKIKWANKTETRVNFLPFFYEYVGSRRRSYCEKIAFCYSVRAGLIKIQYSRLNIAKKVSLFIFLFIIIEFSYITL